MPRTILVTGGAGFIGSHLVDRLIKEGYKVIAVDNLSTGKKENLNPKAKFYKVDICSPKISQIFKKEKPEIIFHYGAQISIRDSIKDPIKDAHTNILGTINIIKNCQENKAKKIIFASSGGTIYGDAEIIPTPETYPASPLSPYGITKLVAEKYLNYYYKIFGLSFISLRLANVYGPRQNSKGEAGVVAIFCDKMLAPYRTEGSGSGLSGGQPVIYGNGKQTRDFVFVDDIVEANILAMKKNKNGIFNIGTAKKTDINTIFEKLKDLTGSNCKKIHGPGKIGEQKRSCLDFLKAKKELGWSPKYDLEKGLYETLKWFKKKD